MNLAVVAVVAAAAVSGCAAQSAGKFTHTTATPSALASMAATPTTAAAPPVLSPTGGTTQHRGPLRVTIGRVGSPGETGPVPTGYTVLSCELEAVNMSDKTIALRYKGGELDLYSGTTPVAGYAGTSSTGGTAGHMLLDGSTGTLPAGGSVGVSRAFLVKPDQGDFTLIYRLPGYGEFRWHVPARLNDYPVL